MSHWRENANLVECFDNCVAMFRGQSPRPKPPKPPTAGEIIRQRRIALGLTQAELGIAAGYSPNSQSASVSAVERDVYVAGNTPIPRALDRLEAEAAAVKRGLA